MNDETKRSKKQWQTAVILFALSFSLGGIFVYVEGRMGARVDQIMDIPPGARQSLEDLCITEGLVCGTLIGLLVSGTYGTIYLIKNSRFFKRSDTSRQF